MTVERFEKHGVWEAVVKADAPPGRALAVRGIISSERRDLQDEVVEQGGLDLTELGFFGWINDNHSKTTGHEFGQVTRTFPATVVGDDGKPYRATGIEGYLFDTEDNRRLHANVVALSKANSPRPYGFSIEGQVLARDPKDRRRIVKARVTQVALTRTPVNTDTALEAMAKSLAALDHTEPEVGAQTGATTGTIAPTVPQDLAGRRMKMGPKSYLAKKAKSGCAEARGHLEEMAKGGDTEAKDLLADLGEVTKGRAELADTLRKSLDELYKSLPDEGTDAEPVLDALPDEVAKALPALPSALRAMNDGIEALAKAHLDANSQLVPAVLAIGEMLLKERSAERGDTSDLEKSVEALAGQVQANGDLLKSLQKHLRAPAAPSGAFSQEQMAAMGRAQGAQPVRKSVGGAPAQVTREELRKSLTNRRDAAQLGSAEWHSCSNALKSLSIGDAGPAQELVARAC